MFLLYQKKEKTFPLAVDIEGNLYYINADFKNILRIFEMLNDENIPENKKINKLSEWFFKSCLPENIPRNTIADAFLDFLGMKKQNHDEQDIIEDEESERQFCYNFDAEEIYASFLSEYSIDLIDIDFLHWHKFKILLGNLSPECAFKKKIELRFMDLSSFHDRPDGGHKFTELARAKESVQLPVYIAETKQLEQLQEIKEFNEIWGKAGNN